MSLSMMARRVRRISWCSWVNCMALPRLEVPDARSVSSRAQRGTLDQRRERSLAALGMTRSLASTISQSGHVAHQLGDDLQHPLVGAAADRAQPAVAVAARHWAVPQVAGAAPV